MWYSCELYSTCVQSPHCSISRTLSSVFILCVWTDPTTSQVRTPRPNLVYWRFQKVSTLGNWNDLRLYSFPPSPVQNFSKLTTPVLELILTYSTLPPPFCNFQTPDVLLLVWPRFLYLVHHYTSFVLFPFYDDGLCSTLWRPVPWP